MTPAAVFAILELVGVGLEYADQIGRILQLDDEQMEELRIEVTRKRRQAVEDMERVD